MLTYTTRYSGVWLTFCFSLLTVETAAETFCHFLLFCTQLGRSVGLERDCRRREVSYPQCSKCSTVTHLLVILGDSGQPRELEKKDGLFVANTNWRGWVGGHKVQ